MASDAHIRIIAELIDRASGPFEAIKKKSEVLGGAFGKVLKVGALGAAAGLGALTIAGIDFIKAAAEDEASTQRLDQALKNVGTSFDLEGDRLRERRTSKFFAILNRPSPSPALRRSPNQQADGLRYVRVMGSYVRTAA